MFKTDGMSEEGKIMDGKIIKMGIRHDFAPMILPAFQNPYFFRIAPNSTQRVCGLRTTRRELATVSSPWHGLFTIAPDRPRWPSSHPSNQASWRWKSAGRRQGRLRACRPAVEVRATAPWCRARDVCCHWFEPGGHGRERFD